MAQGIDPYTYGHLTAQVEAMGKMMEKMDKANSEKLGKLEKNIEDLMALANKSKGGLWAGMAIVSGISGFLSFITGWWLHK